jgi:glutaryl-CoA dehydrogenase
MEFHEASEFYHLEELLSDEERMIRDTIRSFVAKEFMPIVTECNRQGRFPTEIVPRLAPLGMLGAEIDGYGCTNVGSMSYGLMNQELERGDSGLRSFVSVTNGLVMYPIHRYGTEEQRERWLPRLASGEAIGCFGLTEADHGSDPGAMETAAKRDGEHFVLNGGKMWITNGSIADLAVVFAKLDGDVRGFLVEKDAPGFVANQIRNKFSLRVSVTSELVFDNCRIPADNLLPGTDVGLRAALSCLNKARYGIAWGALGSAMACYEEALRFAANRVQFDKPIAGFQLVQNKLVWMVTEIVKGWLLCWRLAKLRDADKASPAQISLAKRNNVEMALQVARTTRDILGAAGICDDYHCGRHMCNLESVYTYEGTHDIHTLIVGEALTGLGAYA